MEISDVRKRVLETIDRAKRAAAGRRTRVDQAGREYDVFLDQIAVPLFRQVANALRAEGYVFNVFTPSGSVRLMSDRSAEDYIELFLDTTADQPRVTGRTSRSRGRRVLESERPIGAPGPITALDEENITVNGATLHVRVGGKGPAVTLLHGYGETGDMWVPLATELARDHTVIVPDLRGIGLSSRRRVGMTRRLKQGT